MVNKTQNNKIIDNESKIHTYKWFINAINPQRKPNIHGTPTIIDIIKSVPGKLFNKNFIEYFYKENVITSWNISIVIIGNWNKLNIMWKITIKKKP